MAALIFKPRWSVREPTAAEVAAFRAGASGADFSYGEVGESRGAGAAPAGYADDRNRTRLGDGEAAFAAACAALRSWRMFPGPWTRILPADAPIRVGTVVAMQAHALGLWWLNACRIVYIVEEAIAAEAQVKLAAGERGGEGKGDGVRVGESSGSGESVGVVRRFGFAYGTLLAHVEQGEELFSVELHADGAVWYEIRAFSRPRYWPVRLASPLARRLQKRFVRESQAAMRALVAEAARR